MRLKIVVSILFSFVACLWVSGAMASSHHDHKAHQAVSPFDNTQDSPSAHCILKNHTHFGFCPHSLLSTNNVAGLQIASDCGGKTPGTIPYSFSPGKNLSVVSATMGFPVFRVAEKITIALPSYNFQLLDSIYHPPRFN